MNTHTHTQNTRAHTARIQSLDPITIVAIVVLARLLLLLQVPDLLDQERLLVLELLVVCNLSQRMSKHSSQRTNINR